MYSVFSRVSLEFSTTPVVIIAYHSISLGGLVWALNNLHYCLLLPTNTLRYSRKGNPSSFSKARLVTLLCLPTQQSVVSDIVPGRHLASMVSYVHLCTLSGVLQFQCL